MLMAGILSRKSPSSNSKRPCEYATLRGRGMTMTRPSSQFTICLCELLNARLTNSLGASNRIIAHSAALAPPAGTSM
jgi:hypothetical protein